MPQDLDLKGPVTLEALRKIRPAGGLDSQVMALFRLLVEKGLAQPADLARLIPLADDASNIAAVQCYRGRTLADVARGAPFDHAVAEAVMNVFVSSGETREATDIEIQNMRITKDLLAQREQATVAPASSPSSDDNDPSLS